MAELGTGSRARSRSRARTGVTSGRRACCGHHCRVVVGNLERGALGKGVGRWHGHGDGASRRSHGDRWCSNNGWYGRHGADGTRGDGHFEAWVLRVVEAAVLTRRTEAGGVGTHTHTQHAHAHTHTRWDGGMDGWIGACHGVRNIGRTLAMTTPLGVCTYFAASTVHMKRTPTMALWHDEHGTSWVRPLRFCIMSELKAGTAMRTKGWDASCWPGLRLSWSTSTPITCHNVPTTRTSSRTTTCPHALTCMCRTHQNQGKTCTCTGSLE